MKTLQYIFKSFLILMFFSSCSDDNEAIIDVDPVKDLVKINEFSAEGYLTEIYSEKTALEAGYNEISLRIKDESNNEYLSEAEVSWMPLMHMDLKEHSAPHSKLSNSVDNSVYTGSIVFQMPGNDIEYWDLQVTLKINGETISQTHRISVLQPKDDLKKIQVFVGNDAAKYVLAFVDPQNPEIGINDLTAVLYKMEDLMTFPVVENYKITVDPRMPGMDNHSSPNNQNLIFNPVTKRYEGKLSLTMTGYWRINLRLLNDSGETVMGKEVTETDPASDLYFELEF